MSQKVKVLDTVIERLKSFHDRMSGALYGFVQDDILYVMGFYVGPAKEYKEDKEMSILLNFPAPIEFCGLVAFEPDFSDGELCDILQKSVATQFPLFIELAIDSVKVFGIVSGNLEEVPFSILTTEDLNEDFLYVRMKAPVPICSLATLSCVYSAIEQACTYVTSSRVTFHFSDFNVDLCSTEFYERSRIVGPDTSFEKLLSSNESPGKSSKGKTKSKAAEITVIEAKIYFSDLINAFDGETTIEDLEGPLMIYVQKREGNHATMNLRLDSLCLLKRNAPLLNFYDFLCLSLERNLRLQIQCFMEHVDGPEVTSDSFPLTYHFMVKELGHFITVVYPVGKSVDDLVSNRKRLHEDLLLPMDRPYFRKNNAYNFSKKVSLSTELPLLNPHESLAPPPVKDGEISLVQGKYLYYHYMQQNFDDNGWGCAYRSLQTIISWFCLQGYMEMEVPNHREIQQCLVDIKDKPESFLGSKQWIGSMEVSFCLDTMLGVTSRILRVESGQELASYAPELQEHFQKHGTPVMIGGGVLAHTIIGVAYNSETDDVMYLVLDPHYTGADDLTTIQKKGWCGWKKVSFWNKNAFYNLCMPQRPVGV